LFRGWLAVLLLLGLSAPTLATHEVDHRYTIWGEVRDAQGAPVGKARVRITGLGGRPIGEGVTDSEGRYSILLHVHNDQLGQHFWVSVGKSTQAGTITFEPRNRQLAREHRLDFSFPAQE
jgi:hypothetical protein